MCWRRTNTNTLWAAAMGVQRWRGDPSLNINATLNSAKDMALWVSLGILCTLAPAKFPLVLWNLDLSYLLPWSMVTSSKVFARALLIRSA